MITNICILALNNEYAKHVAKLLSNELEMYYADIVDLLTFDFINLAEAEDVVGIDYLIQQEKTKIKTISSYENTIITLDYKCLNNDENYNNLHAGSLIIYLKLSENALKRSFVNFKHKVQLELNLQPVREELLISKSDITIDVKMLSDKSVKNKIIKALEDYYEHRRIVR